jgi:hypothetical protein
VLTLCTWWNDSNGIEGIQWQTTLHGKGKVFHENSGTICLVIMRSSFIDVVKHQFYHRWRMLMANLHYIKTFFNPYLLVEACLHANVNAKKALK